MQEIPSPSSRRMLLVLGMHRSGTSALAGMLTHLGAWPGTRLIPAADDNPKGFFEHVDVFAANQALLEELDSDWDDPTPLPHGWLASAAAREAAKKIRAVLHDEFAATPLAVIKDPRLCRLMPLWREVLAAEGWQVGVVLAVRAPLDAIASMVKRDALRMEEAAGVWLRYELEAEAATRGMARAAIAYEALLGAWRPQAQYLAAALGVVWPRTLEQAGADVDAFLDVGLQHHRRGGSGAAIDAELAPPLADWVGQVHAALISRDVIATDALDAVSSTLSRVDREAMLYSVPLTRLRLKSRRVEAERDWQRGEAEGMQAGIARLEGQVQDYAAERERMAAGNARLEQRVRELGEVLDRRQWELDAQGAELARRNAELARRDDELARRNAELAQLYASRSWRITRPLRAVARRLRGLRGGPPVPVPSVPVPAVVDAPAVPVPVPSTVRAPSPPPRLAESLQSPATVPLQATRRFEAATGLRILLATPDIVGPIRNGGIGTAFHALALTLAEAGHAVTIAYTLDDHCEGDHGIDHWVRHYAALGVRFVPLKLDTQVPVLDAPWHPRRAYSLYLWLRQHQADYDIAYFPEWKGEAYYALQARHLGLDFACLAMVIVTHSPTAWARSGNYQLPTELALLDLEFMERRVAEMADLVVSPSQYMLDWVARCGWRITAPAHVIQNLMVGAPASAPDGVDTVVVHEWVFFGRLELRKGLRVFLDALARVPAERRRWHAITFLGKATRTEDFDPFALIQEKLGDWPQPPQIITDCDRDQALAYLKQPGRLAVIASLVENSPYTVLECLMERVPFIAADVGGIAELVRAQDRPQVLFKPNPGALGALLERLEGEPYALPAPAVSADATHRQWLALQESLHAIAQRGFTEPAGAAPHITVCLVHHDRPALLARALASLRAQTYTDFDVVLVDDGSVTPAAKTYLDDIEPDFARRGWILVRQDNAYLGAARNAAVRHARGEYVMFMDDDNLAKPEELAVFARAARHVDADILTTVSDVFDAAGDPPGESRQLWIPLGNAPGLGAFRNVFGDANALVRRRLFESLGGFTEDYGVGHEDWEFFARASLSGARIDLVPQPLFWYQVDAHSMLRGGQADINHARSLRPYREHLGNGVGAALAYASHLDRHAPAVAAPPHSSPSPSLLRVATGVFRASDRARFRELLNSLGWRATLGRALRYIGRIRLRR